MAYRWDSSIPDFEIIPRKRDRAEDNFAVDEFLSLILGGVSVGRFSSPSSFVRLRFQPRILNSLVVSSTCIVAIGFTNLKDSY